MWFRGDLRLHDNEALTRANSESSSLLAIYCFDPRDYGKSPHGYDKTGPYRANFLIQAVTDLRKSLRAAGSELMVRLGKPEEVIPEIVRKTGASAVYCQSEPTCEENQVESKVKSALEGGGGCGARLQSFWGGTLHALDDLPFTLASLPQTFEQYRASLKNKEARRALEEPSQLRGTPLGVHLDAGEIPSLAELGLKPIISNSSSDDDDDGRKTSTSQAGSENSSGKLDGTCLGGESEALRQLQQFLGSMKGSSTATATTATSSTNSTVTAYGSNFASCIAPWLATGCLSPRRMIEDVKSHLGGDSSSCSTTSDNNNTTGQQQQQLQQSALTWVQFELLWRDFFRMMTRRYAEAPLVKKRLGEVETSRERGSSMVPATVQ
jgi:deoxyribodipyrimidine photolyase